MRNRRNPWGDAPPSPSPADNRRQAVRAILTVVMLVTILGALGGVVLARLLQIALAKDTPLDAETRLLQTKHARFAIWLRTITSTLWRGLLLALFAGLIVRAFQWLDKRRATIYPDEAGIFPVIKIRTGPVTTLHDINRQTAAIVRYSKPEHAARITVVETDRPDQLPVTMGALAVQHEAAKHRWPENVVATAKAPPPAQPAIPPAALPLQWPETVPLAKLLGRTPPALDNLVLGVTLDELGQQHTVRRPLDQLKHIGIAGDSGYGKSAFLKTLAAQFIMAPDELLLVMIDLEAVTLSPFAHSDRLLYPLATTEAEAAAVLRALSRDELDRRRALYERHPAVDKLATYNALAAEPLPHIVCIIDETTSLLDDRDVEDALKTIALRARKYGMHLIMGGQHWTSKSIPTAIRDQLRTRVAFKSSKSHSRLFLDTADAAEIAVPGRALAKLPGEDIIELQTPYLSTREIRARFAVQTGAPRRPMPALTQAAGAASGSGPDPNVARILDLAADGLSQSEIEEAIFGYTGGKAYREVSRVLKTHADHGDNGSETPTTTAPPAYQSQNHPVGSSSRTNDL